MPRTRLYLVRHGEQDPATSRAPTGGLSALGRDQAERAGRRLAGVPFDAIHHSPLTRAAETAALIGAHLPSIPRHACDHVADRTPVPSPEARDDYPARWHAWLDETPPDERDEDAAALRAAVAHFGVVAGRDRHELLITHNFVIGWFVRHALDAPAWRWLGLNQENAALTIVEWTGDRPPMLVAFNDTGHLA
ncbi:histidine phosphatase family protein [Actinoplanes sp. CA-030573]|uniref:histidine phosphatase family protein n=1 Tax=Actinoplanes sp. CA-030573 TaxID=3239898 RepID=UPI003D89DA46